MADETVIIEVNEQNVGEYDPNPYDNVTVEEALKQLFNRFTPRTVRQAIFTMAENNKPATLVEKSITENGEYSAKADNADGYSRVTVDVAGGGGGETFEVVFSSPDFVEWTANKSYAETLSAIENGDNVRFKFVNSGETMDSTGYYLFVEENHPENDKIIMITMSSAYISNRMATMFLKWTINDEIAMIQLEEQS